MPALNISSLRAPGTYVSQNVGGALPVSLATFQNAYMVGSVPITGWYAVGDANPVWAVSTLGEANTKNAAKYAALDALIPANVPVQIVDLVDYVATVCGGKEPTMGAALISYNSAKLFFRNVQGGVFYFVRTKPQDQTGFNLDTAISGLIGTTTAGTVLTFTVNGVDVTYTVPTTGQAPIITIQAIFDAILNNVYVGPQVYLAAGTNFNTGAVYLASKTGRPLSFVVGTVALARGFTVAPTAGATVTTVAANQSQPALADYVGTVFGSFDSDVHEPGFLFAPEAFATLGKQTERTAMAIAIENHCSDEAFTWLGIIDCGAPLLAGQTPVVGNTYINNHAEAYTESQLITSASGFFAFFAPYLVDLENQIVPPSAGVVGVAITRFRNSGFQTPPAGAKFPIKGVLDVQFRITRANQQISNENGLNAIRLLPNLGVVIWGARTRTSSPYFKFINSRIIVNVLMATFRTAFDTEIFSVIDGQGLLYGRVRETANQICYQLFSGNALFGLTPADAFLNVCDTTNNSNTDLESGAIRLDTYVQTSPTLEKLIISVTKLAIGGVKAQAIALG